MILLGMMKLDLCNVSKWKSIVSPLGLVHNVLDPTLVVLILEANLVMMESGSFPSLNLNP